MGLRTYGNMRMITRRTPRERGAYIEGFDAALNYLDHIVGEHKGLLIDFATGLACAREFITTLERIDEDALEGKV